MKVTGGLALYLEELLISLITALQHRPAYNNKDIKFYLLSLMKRK